MRRSHVAAAIVVAAVCAPALPARAGTTEEHRARMVVGQLLRRDGKLLRAREIFAGCAREACDDEADDECRTIRRFCTERLTELGRTIPSVIVGVVDDRGAPLPTATIAIAGQVVPAGELVELDPGPFSARATWLGRVGVAEGRAASGVEGQRVPLRIVIDLRTTSTSRPVPWGVPALAAVAGVGLAAFAGLGLATLGQDSSLARCAPTCPWSRREAYTFTSVGADVALGISLAAATGALLVWWTRPTRTRTERLGAEVR